MPNTNFNTIIQMPSIVNDFVKQSTGRNSVSRIDMDFVTVGQANKEVQHTIDYTSLASFINNSDLPLGVLVKFIATQSGTGDPTPTNVRPITGYTSGTVIHYGDDISDADEYTVSFPETSGTVYGGILDVTNGKLTITFGIYNMKTLPWHASGTTEHAFYASSFPGAYKQGESPVSMCTCYKYGGTVSATAVEERYVNNTYKFRIRGGPVSGTEIYIQDNNYSSVEDFVDSLTDQIIIYELDIPVVVDVDSETIKSFIGENNLSADIGNIAVSYTSYIPVP